MSDKNMALLSQSEIDTLIEFLSEQKNEVNINGDTLSQSSINKLIKLIRSTPAINKGVILNKAALEKDAASFFANASAKEMDSYELTFKYEENGQINLVACNVYTDAVINVSPDYISGHPEGTTQSSWGICVLPSAFDHIAKKLGISYSKETFSQLKRLFAKKMYGNENAAIPDIYLP